MKSIILAICVFIAFQTGMAQEMSATQWKEDINYLRNLVDEKYPFLYKKITKENFHEQAEALVSQNGSREDYEVVAGIMKLVSSFGYGHTSIGLRDTPFTLTQLPVHLKEFKDGIFIEGASAAHADHAGAKVLQIAGSDVKEVYKRVYPYFPAENSQFFKAYGMNYLVYTELLTVEGFIESPTDEVTLTLEKDGKVYEQVFQPMEKGKRAPTAYGFTKNEEGWVSARDTTRTPYYIKHLDRIYYSEVLPGENTMYVRHSQIQDDSLMAIPEFYKKVFNEIEEKGIQKLVIDVRLNGGGNNYKNRAVIREIIAHPGIDKVGSLFVILGDRTFSACQNLVNELDNYTNAIFIGEPTGENINFYGDNNKEELPNSKIPVYLSFAWWQDKPQWENQEWLPPHIAVQPTFKAYKNNEDPVLEAALNFDDSDFILDPMDHLTVLFMKGDVETLKKEAFRLSRDERYTFFNFEDRFNDIGERLFNQGQTQESLFVYQLNTELYPESAWAWAGLARSLQKAGNPGDAKAAASRALELSKNQPETHRELTALFSELPD